MEFELYAERETEREREREGESGETWNMNTVHSSTLSDMYLYL
jgi:hypothetical protein